MIRFKLFGNGYSEKVNPLISFAVGEAAFCQVVPLSEEVRVVPEVCVAQ